MDALYLKENINDAISDGLTAMVVQSPDDPIEFLGNYLLNYVDRQIEKKHRETDAVDAVAKAEEYEKELEKETVEKTLATDASARYEKKLAQFVENLPNTTTTKEEAFDAVTKFLSEYLDVPAVYVAVRKTVKEGEGENEVLHYFSSAGKDQEMMVGKKLPKPGEPDDPENPPPRVGLSFEAFKIPDAPEPEEVELEEGEEPPPPPPPPKATPLIVDNCMRDTRTKFFGIPKLGSYAAIPFFLSSLEHDAGCVLGPQPEPVAAEEGAEEGAPPPEQPEPWPLYVPAKIQQGILVGMDTVGAYRRFSPKDIEIANTVGDALIATCEKLEQKLFDNHLDFMTMNTPMVEPIAAVPASLADAEAAALAAIAAEIGENPIMEQLKASKEADAISEVWTNALTTSPVKEALEALNSHYLPPVQSGVNSVYGVLSFCGVDTQIYVDLCGDVSWTKIRADGCPQLYDLIKTYNHTDDECATFTDASFKAYIESTGLVDPSILPPSIPVLGIMLTWAQKMMTSRELRLAYVAAKAEADAAAAEEARLAEEAAAAAAAEEE